MTLREDFLNVSVFFVEISLTCVHCTGYALFPHFVDYFLIGVDTEKQLQHILNLGIYERHGGAILNMLNESIDEKWLDPRTWN